MKEDNIRCWTCNSNLSTKQTILPNYYIMANLQNQSK